MSDLKSIEDVADIVSSEGLDYAILHYMSSEEIEDEALSSLWEQAKTVLSEINAILEPYSEEM